MISMRKQVVIIGAGAAGIAAATRLYEAGITNIVVLEAENRIGGRVHTINLDGNIEELGAQWIHGEKRNVVFELASAQNKHMYSQITFNEMTYVRSSGEIIDKTLVEKLWKLFIHILEELEVSDLMQHRDSGDFIIDKFNKMFESKEYYEIPSDLRGEFIEYCHQILNMYHASNTWFDSSPTNLTEYSECSGWHYTMWKEGGYQTLFSVLMEKCQSMSNGIFVSENIITDTEVTRLSQDNNCVKVECSNSKVFFADHVIITVSLGVLKDFHKALFDQLPLSEEKVQAIDGLASGTVDKMFLKFPNRWWPADIAGFALLWTEKDREEFCKQGLEWVTNVFAICRVEHSPLVLCAWVCGQAAQTMELQEEKKVQELLMHIVRKFLGNKFQIPEANHLNRSTWSTNKHFRGSYSFRSTKSDELGVWSSSLAIPIINQQGVPIVLFAGEATHSHYYSAVHGAVESGWREANRIIFMSK